MVVAEWSSIRGICRLDGNEHLLLTIENDLPRFLAEKPLKKSSRSVNIGGSYKDI